MKTIIYREKNNSSKYYKIFSVAFEEENKAVVIFIDIDYSPEFNVKWYTKHIEFKQCTLHKYISASEKNYKNISKNEFLQHYNVAETSVSFLDDIFQTPFKKRMKTFFKKVKALVK